MITLEDALRVYETKANLARALEITPQAITQWAGKVPMKQQYRLKYELAPESFKETTLID